jgi:hypothetical protein
MNSLCLFTGGGGGGVLVVAVGSVELAYSGWW